MPILTKRTNKTSLGIYIHVPFCRSKCQYCDFYSLANKDDSLMDGYLDATCAHIREAGALAPGYKVDTIFFGGGTPSFFGADGMAAILATIRKSFQVSNTAEITFEANPRVFLSTASRTACTDSSLASPIKPHVFRRIISTGISSPSGTIS